MTVLSFLLVIGVLVTFHEFGHFLAARLCGVKVLTFSIGFGKPLWARTIGDTEWRLAWIPLGGFVRMLDGARGTGAPADRPRAFNQRPGMAAHDHRAGWAAGQSAAGSGAVFRHHERRANPAAAAGRHGGGANRRGGGWR